MLGEFHASMQPRHAVKYEQMNVSNAVAVDALLIRTLAMCSDQHFHLPYIATSRRLEFNVPFSTNTATLDTIDFHTVIRRKDFCFGAAMIFWGWKG